MSDARTIDSGNDALAIKKHGAFADFLIRLFREKPLGTVTGIMSLIIVLVAIFADVLMPYPYQEMHMRDAFQSSSAQYILGTDNLGRDLLSRVIYGTRISIVVGLVGSLVATTLSTILGIVSGYFGGKVDIILQRFVDSWMCFPGLLLMISMIAFIGPGLWQVIVVISLLYAIGGSRIIRGAVISTKQNVYVQAAEAIGCSTPRMLLRHILPNVMAPVIVLFMTRLPSMILLEASMSFLGYGIPAPTPSWGGLLGQSGRNNMLVAPWIALWPGICISLVVFSFNLFGDSVRDLLDPRMRGGLGRYGGAKIKKSRTSKASV